MLPNTRHIHVDDQGWALHHRALHTISWDNPYDDRLTVMFSMEPPDLPAAPDGSEASLHLFRARSLDEMARARGAALEVACTTVQGLPALRTLFRMPHRPAPGTLYVGSLVVPFAEWAYVLRIQTSCREAWSERHRVVFARRMADPTARIDPATASPTDWIRPTFGGPPVDHARTTAELPEHDDLFPNDPLTRNRRTLDHLEASTWFDDGVLAAPRFAGNG